MPNKIKPCRKFAKSGVNDGSIRTVMHVWTEPLRLNLLGPGNGHVTYLDRFCDLVPKNLL